MDIQNNAFKVRIQPIRPPQELFVSLGTRRSRTQDARDSTHVQTSAAAARTLNQHDCCIVRSGAWLFCSNTRGGKNGVVWSFLAGRVCDRPGFAQTPFSCVAEKKASACLVYLLLVGFCCARRGKRFVSVATTRRERVLYLNTNILPSASPPRRLSFGLQMHPGARYEAISSRSAKRNAFVLCTATRFVNSALRHFKGRLCAEGHPNLDQTVRIA